jgi:mannose-1-phosphate guanylyltransferase
MKVILLAAGFGTRLRPLTNNVPKCLVPIKGVPLLQIWLDNLFNSGININEILINTHHLSEKVVDFINNSKYRDKIIISHENSLKGTAGTVLENIEYIANEPVMVIHADNLSKFNVIDFMSAHQSRPIQCNMTMMLFKTVDPKSCGIVEIDQSGVVTNFYEKSSNPPSNLANAAVYILEAELVRDYQLLDPKITDISTELIPRNLGKIFTFLNTQYHRDIGNLESLKLANIEYIF